MYFNDLDSMLTGYNLGNIIDEDGYVTKNVDKNFKIVYPPKSKDTYANEKAYNAAMTEYNSFKDNCKKYYDAMVKTAKLALSPQKESLLTKSEIKNVINQVNKENDRLNKIAIKRGQKPENLTKPFTENFDLTKQEIQERKKYNADAKEILAKNEALFKISSQLIIDYGKKNGIEQVSRPSQLLLAVGCDSVDDLFRDFDVLVNGSANQKQQMFERKYAIMKQACFDMCEQKSNSEYVEYFNKNFINVFSLGELEPSKMKISQRELGFTFNDTIIKEIDENYNSYVGVGSEQRIIAGMANPYFTLVKENIFKATDVIEHSSSTLGVDPKYVTYNRINEEGNLITRDVAEAKTGTPMLKHFNVYLANQGFGKNEKMFTYDFAYMYFLKNKDIITKVVDDNGNVYKGTPKELAEKTSEILKNKKGVLVYDKLGNLKGKLQVINHDMCDVPSSYKGLKTVNFKFSNSVQQIRNLKNEFSKLDSIFSKDHQEYKNIKEYISLMEKSYNKGTSLSTLCHGLRRLAVDYMESKYAKDTPQKTDKTFEREAFMCNLISTIDSKYPIEYPVEVKKNTIKDVLKPTKEEQAFLQSVIQKNAQGKSRAKVEEYIEQHLNQEPQKTQIEVNINDKEPENAKEEFGNANNNNIVNEKNMGE